MLSYLGGAVSMLAATFIVFSALSMGVAERQRTLAMLARDRRVSQQLGMLVIIEGILLASIGVAVGVPLGILWMKILVWRFPEIFAAGMSISWGGMLLASFGSMRGAGRELPAGVRRHARLSAGGDVAAGDAVRCACRSCSRLAGLVLDLHRSVPDVRAAHAHRSRSVAVLRAFLSSACPALMIGFFLLAPMFRLGDRARRRARSSRR